MLQPDLNGATIGRCTIYRVVRAYPQSPHIRICVGDDDDSVARKTYYALGPRTPVLFPSEFDPTEDEVEKFLLGSKRSTIVGYRILWNGDPEKIKTLRPQAAAAMKALLVEGRREHTVNSLGESLDRGFGQFYRRSEPSKCSGREVFRFYRTRLVALGLIEVVTDAPLTEVGATTKKEER